MNGIDDFKALWADLIPAPPPNDRQFEMWTALFNEKAIRFGLFRLALKYKKLGPVMGADYRIKYASALMWNFSKSHQAKEAA